MEDKNLLLKDLCARLIYNVIVEYRGAKVNLTQYARSIKLEDCKPYLRSMNSMTEEEKKEVEDLNMNPFSGSVTDWLNAHHFDYRDLIPMNLALEAPKDMYNIK